MRHYVEAGTTARVDPKPPAAGPEDPSRQMADSARPAPAAVADLPVTEFDFVLPRGYVDDSGNVHHHGTMRLATARDELVPQIDPRVKEHHAYLGIVVLARVVTRLGDLDKVTTGVIEGMWATDVSFLQDLYRRVNTEGHTKAAITCPSCDHEFAVDMAGDVLGE